LWQLAPEWRVPGEGPERSFSKRVPESVWEYLGSHAQAVDALDEAIYKEETTVYLGGRYTVFLFFHIL